MAQRLELDVKHPSLPYPNLWDEDVVKKLIKEGRTPIIVKTDGEILFDRASCFIPAGDTESSRSFKLDIDEAGEIAKTIDKIMRPH